MDTLNRYKYHILVTLILLTVLLMSAKTKISLVTKAPEDLPRVKTARQLEHALELFKGHKKAMAMSTSQGMDLRAFILKTVQRAVPAAHRGLAMEIAHAVITEANHHHMDPLFLLAVIATESQFNVNAIGSQGEIGLMQVMPKTAHWLAQKAEIDNKFNLQSPAVNIRIGATYLARLRKNFRRNSLHYVAAYNMGSGNVRRLLAVNREPKIYSSRVLNNYEQIYLALPGEGSLVDRNLASTR